MEQADLAQSLNYYEQALPLYEQLNDKRGQSDVLNNLGNVAHARGDFSHALSHWDQAKPLYEAISDKSGSCRLLINQSAVCLNVGF